MANTKSFPDLYLDQKPSSNAALQAVLCFSGIKQLKALGPNSNYLDWEFVIDQFLQATKVLYMVTPIEESCFPESWAQDNTSVCLVITCTVHSLNYCYIQVFQGNASGIWEALKTSHQDSFTGGCMFWIS